MGAPEGAPEGAPMEVPGGPPEEAPAGRLALRTRSSWVSTQFERLRFSPRAARVTRLMSSTLSWTKTALRFFRAPLPWLPMPYKHSTYHTITRRRPISNVMHGQYTGFIFACILGIHFLTT